MRMKKTVLAVLLAAGLAAGCGTNTADSSNTKTAGIESAVDAESTADEAGADDSGAADESTEGRTEVRREKYDDCDGSGHGYVEIYYSDGSMETEEY